MSSSRRRRLAATALFAALVAGAAACTLLVDTKGLSGGPLPASSDGATANGEAGSPPPPGDGGGAEAAGDSDARAGRFCDAHKDAILCEDFDGPPLAQDRTVTMFGSAVVAAAGDARSAPNVLVATIPAVQGGNVGRACYASPPIATTKFHVSLDALVVTGTSAVVVNAYANDNLGDNFQGEVLGDSTFALFQEFSQFVDGGGSQPMGVGLPVNLTPVWHHLDVCYDFATGARSVSIDGAHPVSATGVSGWPKTATIYFGAQFASNAPKEEVHVDNVLVDTTGCPR